MNKNALYKLTRKCDAIGLLCNHTAWRTADGKYTFQLLAETGRLKKIFIPEHGLFGELQDQAKLDDTTVYKPITGKTTLVSLYSSKEHDLSPAAEHLRDIDTLVVDIQDTGCRYYTYITSFFLLLQKISLLRAAIKIIVLDKPNPAGRLVEGTRMTARYASFIGLEGLPHRHGLTIGELCRYFKNKLNAAWELIIFPADKKNHLFIAPSPNIPSVSTCRLYSGQCLWEGTNISEGRGTIMPFEITGAPFMDWVFTEEWNNKQHPAFDKACQLRPVRFIPVFHKYANEICSGLHLLPRKKEQYHSLSHSLRLIRYCREKTDAFRWREGKYEAFSDHIAIELLAGDDLLTGYLNGKNNWKEVAQQMQEEESAWTKEAKSFLIYKPGLQQKKT